MSRDILVLLSGGLDSTTVLTQTRKDTDANICCVAFKYGQRHEMEIEAAQKVAEYFGIDLFVINAPIFRGDSILMDSHHDMVHMTYSELEQARGVSPTYVPFRNGTFLSMATGFALERGLTEIHIGVHAEDARGWAYPDCTPEFIGAMANAIYVGTYHKVRLIAPLQYLMKKDIVHLGLDLAAPFHLTHSCYTSRPACGQCPTCVSRLEAFKANDVRDPIEYAFDQYGSFKDAKATAASLELKGRLENG